MAYGLKACSCHPLITVTTFMLTTGRICVLTGAVIASFGKTLNVFFFFFLVLFGTLRILMNT